MTQHDMPPLNHERLIDVDALKYINVDHQTTLRLLTLGDAEEAIAAINSDPAIRKYVYVASLIHSVGDVAKQIDEMQNDGELLRYVIENDNHIVGMVNFWRAGNFFGSTVDPNVCGFGYFLVPTARGKGILSRTLNSLITIAKESIDVPEFIAFCEDSNSESRAVLERVGMTATDETINFSKLSAVERKYVMKVGR